MKTIKTEEITTCDHCSDEIAFSPNVCHSCNEEHCGICASNGLAVRVGAREVYYCRGCLNVLSGSSSDPIYSTVVKIDELEKEWDRISRDHREKQRELVDKLEKLLPKPYF